MEIEGTYTLQAPVEDVWRSLMDQQTLERVIPGLERLTPIDEHNYTFTIHVRHAPLRGNYAGCATVYEPCYPTSYRLKIEGEGPSSQFSSEADIQLSTHNANTVISYRSTIQIGRGGKLISATWFKGIIKVLLQQFFAALADQLRGEQEGPVYMTTLEEMYEMPFMEEQLSEHLLAGYQKRPPTYLHRLVRLLRLGQQNPLQEELWVRRLRQTGIVAVLLLLVWVGTRLPKRPATRP
jgi:uncharacterized protein